MTEKRKRRNFTDEFKKQVVNYTKLESQGLKLLNSLIDQTLIVFGIERLLSKKGSLY